MELAQQAIRAALEGNWKEAERLNKQILKQNSKDIEALNRLARAQAELGKTRLATSSYKKVIKLDPYNSIAQKGLERLSKTKKTKKKEKHHHPVETSFIEEPGKTKTLSLIHLGSREVIDGLDTGQPVILAPHKHRVSVQTEIGSYIGRLPDDISRRLIKLTRAGNQYKALVRSINEGVKVFIKEIKRAPELSDTPSFPSTEKSGYISFTAPDLVHEEKPEMTTLEDEEEN